MNEEGGESGITPSSLKKGKYRRRNLSGLNLCLPIQISINIYKIINRDGLQSFHIWLFVLFSHKIITDLILSLKYGVLIDSGKERDLARSYTRCSIHIKRPKSGKLQPYSIIFELKIKENLLLLNCMEV